MDETKNQKYLYGKADLWGALHPQDREGYTEYNAYEKNGINQGTNDSYFKKINALHAKTNPVVLSIVPEGILYYGNGISQSSPKEFDPDDYETTEYYLYFYVPNSSVEDPNTGVRTIYRKNKNTKFPLPQSFPRGTIGYYCADPVEVTSGSFVWNYTDLKILGKYNMDFSRFYDSSNKRNGSLGIGFYNNHGYSLDVDDEKAYFELPTGEGIPFAFDEAENKFKPNSEEQTDYTLNFYTNSLFMNKGSFELYEDQDENKGTVYKAEITKINDYNDVNRDEQDDFNNEPVDAENNQEVLVREDVNKNQEVLTQEDIYDNQETLVQGEIESSNEVLAQEELNNNQKLLVQEKVETQVEDKNLRIQSREEDRNQKENIFLTDEGELKLPFADESIVVVDSHQEGNTTIQEIETESGEKYKISITEQEEVRENSSKRKLLRASFSPENKNYIVTSKEGTEYHFNSDKQITKIIHNGEDIYTYEYRDGKMSKVIGKYGAYFEYAYNTEAKISKITDFNNNYVSFVYDGDLLVKSTNADGDSLSYAYDKNGNMLSITDFNGVKYLENKYDDKNRVVWQFVADRGEMTISYDDTNRITTYKDAKGSVTKYYFDENSQVTKVEKDGEINNEFNSKNQVTSQKDKLGRETKFEYDILGRQNKVIYPDGSSKYIEYNMNNMPIGEEYSDGTSIEYTYDGKNNVTSVKDRNGNKSKFEYDGDGNLISSKDRLGNETKYTYDMNGFLAGKIDSLGNETRYSYDKAGKLLSETSPEGKVTSYEYTAAGKLLSKTYPDGEKEYFKSNGNGYLIESTNRAGDSKSIVRDALGQALSESDYEGNLTSFQYDALGRLVKTTDPLGYSESSDYDADGNIISRTDKNGNSSSYTYDAENQMLTSKNTLGGTTTFSYDLMGRVELIENPRSAKTEYTYDESGRMIQEKNTLGGTKEYTYDSNGNILTSKDESGNMTSYKYDAEDRLIESADVLGNKTEFKYDSVGRLTETITSGHSEKSSYNNDGERISTTDKESNSTIYEYNELGLLSKEIRPDGTEQFYEYDLNGNLQKTVNSENQTYSYKYDKNGNLIESTDPLGNKSILKYNKRGELIETTDANGNITKFEYDGNGNPIKQINPDGGIITNEYNGEGLITKESDPEGNARTYEYDSTGNLIKVNDALGNSRTLEYDLLDRNSSVVNEVGGKYTFEYTPTGKPKKTVDEEGGVTEYSYDAKERITQIKNEAGYTKSFKYDEFDRVIETTDENDVVRKFEYTPNGNIKSASDGFGNITKFEYDSLNRTTKETDPKGNVTSYKYDINGNIAEMQTSKGTVKFDHDAIGRIKSVIDEKGNESKYEYDKNGNIIKVTDPQNNETSYGYDSANRLIKMDLKRIDSVNSISENQTTVYKYDKRGLLIEEVNANSDSKICIYDGNGNLKSVKDEDGKVTDYSYNELNLVKEINYNGEKSALYAYNKKGVLTEVNDWNGKTSIKNDLRSMVTEITDHNGRETKFNYDGVGNRTEIGYPNGSAVKYEFNAENQVTKVSDSDGKETLYNYDNFGQLKEMLYPNGEKTVYDYNGLGETVKATEMNAGELIKSTGYEYDALGNITKESIQEPKAIEPAIEKIYSYDSNNRLISTKISNSLTEYKYDSLGNLVQENTDAETTNYKYNILNQLTSKNGKDGAFSYTYDKRGNTLTETKDGALTKNYEFDASNRLAKGSNEFGEESIYTYNGLGKRIKTEQTIKNPSVAHTNNLNSLPRILTIIEGNVESEEQANPTLFNKISLTAVQNLKSHVDENSLVIQNEMPTVITDYVIDYGNIFGSPLMTFEEGSYETKYVYGNDYKKIYQTVKETKAEENPEDLTDVQPEKPKAPYMEIATNLIGTSYFHYNIIDTTTSITLEDGSVIAKPVLDEWGKISSETKHDENFAGLDDINNYTGHRYDNILESYYAQARNYNPNARRFVAEDIVKDGMNWYAYVDGNPVNAIDPNGKETWNNILVRDYYVNKGYTVSSLIITGSRSRYINVMYGSTVISNLTLWDGLDFEIRNNRAYFKKAPKISYDVNAIKANSGDVLAIAACSQIVLQGVGQAAGGSSIVTVASSVIAGLGFLSVILGVTVVVYLGYTYTVKKGIPINSSVPANPETWVRDYDNGFGAVYSSEMDSPSDDCNSGETALPNQGEVKGDVVGAPPVDAGKQGKHVIGHVNNKDTSSSTWKEGETGVNETQEAWLKGTTLPDGTKVNDTGRVVGSKGETGVRVHMDGKGRIHGYPVNPGRYLGK